MSYLVLFLSCNVAHLAWSVVRWFPSSIFAWLLNNIQDDRKWTSGLGFWIEGGLQGRMELPWRDFAKCQLRRSTGFEIVIRHVLRRHANVNCLHVCPNECHYVKIFWDHDFTLGFGGVSKCISWQSFSYRNGYFPRAVTLESRKGASTLLERDVFAYFRCKWEVVQVHG